MTANVYKHWKVQVSVFVIIVPSIVYCFDNKLVRYQCKSDLGGVLNNTQYCGLNFAKAVQMVGKILDYNMLKSK